MRALAALLLVGLVLGATILAHPGPAAAATFQVNVSQTGADTFRVNSGDLPAGTLLLTDGCPTFAAPAEALLTWFDPGSSLNEVLFSNGTFCALLNISPLPVINTPTPLPPFDDAFALSGPFDFTLVPGQTIQYHVMFENIGNTIWRSADGYVLRETGTGGAVALGSCDPVAPDEFCDWLQTFTAGAPGSSMLHYRMFHGATAFGDTILVNLTVPGATGTPVMPTASASPTAGASTLTVTPTPKPSSQPSSPTAATPATTLTATPTAPAATATSASARSPTAVGGTIGGRGLTISPNSLGVLLTWQGGVGQTGYLVARLADGTMTLTPPTGLTPSATSFLDLSATTGAVCYLLLPLGRNPQALSDLVCAVLGIHSGIDAPQGLSLQFNQSSQARITWQPPPSGPPDRYLLIAAGEPARPVPPSTTSLTVPVNGLSCYMVGAVRGGMLTGYTDFVCGLPGISNLGSEIQRQPVRGRSAPAR